VVWKLLEDETCSAVVYECTTFKADL